MSDPRVVFAFFGHPGAGKSTLCLRFGELHGVPALDTDLFMTPEEREAVEAGRYTQAMRLANIDRYCARARELLRAHPAVALADGLPNAESRERLRSELGGARARVVFVLVETPPDLWRRRLQARGANTVRVGVAEAEAYVREHWEPDEGALQCERIENGEDANAVDAALRGLFERHVAGR
ncbi:MAG TPA: AAA family ATPase [Dehalococcoidia bacterium]|nr:AAA family ATPase [Dehalococcoidia bacterium]